MNAKKEDMELYSFYMVYLMYIHDTMRTFPKDGIDFSIENTDENTGEKSEQNYLMTFTQDRRITVIGPKFKTDYESFEDFKQSEHFRPVIDVLCRMYPGITDTYDKLIEMGIRDYQNIKMNENGFIKKYKDPVLGIYTEYEVNFRTNYGGQFKIAFNAITGECRLFNEYAEYEGKINDAIFVTSEEYTNSISYEDIENRIISFEQTAENGVPGFLINGRFYEHVEDFFEGQKLLLNLDDIQFDEES